MNDARDPSIRRSPLGVMARKWPAVVTFLLTGISYVFMETRHPVLNYDDTYLLGHVFPNLRAWMWHDWNVLLFNPDSGTNEFRTYLLAKAVYYGLFRLFGTTQRGYYFVMAFMACTAAALIARVVAICVDSLSSAATVFFAILIGPFSLFQTFHHAAYILLPLMLSGAYATVRVRDNRGASRRLAGCCCASWSRFQARRRRSSLPAASHFSSLIELQSIERVFPACSCWICSRSSRSSRFSMRIIESSSISLLSQADS